MVSACMRPVAPAPAVIRNSPPPWDAPRDAVSYIEAAGLTPEPLNSTGESHIVTMVVVVDGWKVPIPAYVGMDRLRAQQAAVHTHDTTNQVWLEGRDIDDITLGQFFTLWAVRFDNRCLGAACGEVDGVGGREAGHRTAEPAAGRGAAGRGGRPVLAADVTLR